MKLYIKNMCCDRCKMTVKSELEKFGLNPTSVKLGEVEIAEELSEAKKQRLNAVLKKLSFELIEEKKAV